MSYRGGKILVQAPEGHTCPWPGHKEKSIGQEPVALPNDRVTRALLGDGSLVIARPRPATAVSKGKREGSK